MSKQKEIRNESVLPDAEIERLAKMLLPAIYDTWERETAAAQQTNENKMYTIRICNCFPVVLKSER